MFDTLTTLFRARAARAEEALIDQNALLILDQQIRDAARALDGSRRALSVAAARNGQERDRLSRLVAQIGDLEDRAVAALRDGADALANRAAETIADLEQDRDAAASACKAFADQYERLKGAAKAADRRLADLERGRRMAEAADAVRRLQVEAPGRAAGTGALTRAETTLQRLRMAQERDAEADRFNDELVPERCATTIRDDLEAAGYGAMTRPTAASVFERLKQRSRAAD